MVEPDLVGSVANLLGHFTEDKIKLQKNVVDDVMKELLKVLPKGKEVDLDDLFKALSGLNVNKVDLGLYKRIKIKYEVKP